MRYLKNSLLLMILVAISMTACVKEDLNTDTTTPSTNEPQELITTTVYGRVLDDNDMAIVGATVTYKSGQQTQTIETDEDGQFLLQNIRNKGKSAFLTVNYDGKFEAFRRLSVLPNRYNYTEVKMNTKSIIGQVAANTGGTLTHNSGAQITLPANGIVDRNGNAYNGSVDVAMAWIDPSSTELPQRMVGDLSGIDEQGNVRSLGSYGMLQIELLDASNNELNLGNNTDATLVFPVPASMQGNAPATIPLWSYDEEGGTWIQEGEATYTNGEYVGKVSHFSSWNVDCMMDPIEVNGAVNVRTENDDLYELSYLQLFVCSEKFGTKGGWLSDDGEFLFYNFPKNEEFVLKVVDRCGQTIYEETYGPYTTNTDLGTITVASTLEVLAVSGNAIDCDDNAVTDGYGSILFEDYKYVFPLAQDGSFDQAFDFCEGATGTLNVVDLTNQLISPDYTFDSSQEVWTFEDIMVCDELTDYIQISVDGGAPALYTPNVEFFANDSLSYISYYSQDELNGNYISVNIRLDGLNPISAGGAVSHFFYANDTNNGQQVFYYSAGLNGNDGVIISFDEYDDTPGGVIRGTFSGIVTSESPINGTQVPISGSFHIPIE